MNTLKELRSTLGESQTAFGKKLGVSRDVINNIENDRVPLKPAFAKLIASTYHADYDWLMTGEGDMFVKPANETEELLLFATDMIQNRDLSWLRILCEYMAQLTPAEVEAVSKFVTDLSVKIAENAKKEQEK